MTALRNEIDQAIRTRLYHSIDDDGLHGVTEAVADIIDVVAQSLRTTISEVGSAAHAQARTDGYRGCLDPNRTLLALLEDRFADLGAVDGPPLVADEVERVARAIARAADADYWVDEIADWEAQEDWERDAHPDNYPSGAYEDRDAFRKQATAAISARTTLPAGTIVREEWGVVVDDLGSTDLYEDAQTAAKHATADAPLVRVLTVLADAKAPQ